ncbi:ATP-binding cassette domain-containing protein, partial [Arthrobacter deserti]|nr:ATP-binding cassette domain-containing protein [Arthrobacter deserti]
MVRVLDGVHLRAFPGEVTALLGPNGAGKTTTLACAQGLLKPDGGTVRLLGQEPYQAGAGLRSR